MKKKFNRKFFIIAIIEAIVAVILIVLMAAFANRYFTGSKPKLKSKNDTAIEKSKPKNKPSEKNNDNKPPAEQKNETNPGKKESPSATTGEQEWLSYTNKRYSFKIGYPSDYTLKESANNDGVTLTKGKNEIRAYGVNDDSKSIDDYISKNYKDAIDIENFSSDGAEGKVFLDKEDKFIVFQKKADVFVVIMAENPDQETFDIADDIAFTYESF